MHVQHEGSMVLITPDSDADQEWLDENLETEGWQWLGKSLAVDQRFAEDLIEGMILDGVTVEVAAS